MDIRVLNELFDREVVEVAEDTHNEKAFFRFKDDTVFSFVSKLRLMELYKEKLYEKGYSAQTMKYYNPLTNKRHDYWDIRLVPRDRSDIVVLKEEVKPLFHESFFETEFEAVEAAIEFIFDRITYEE